MMLGLRLFFWLLLIDTVVTFTANPMRVLSLLVGIMLAPVMLIALMSFTSEHQTTIVVQNILLGGVPSWIRARLFKMLPDDHTRERVAHILQERIKLGLS
jgi:hypothetical protein